MWPKVYRSMEMFSLISIICWRNLLSIFISNGTFVCCLKLLRSILVTSNLEVSSLHSILNYLFLFLRSPIIVHIFEGVLGWWLQYHGCCSHCEMASSQIGLSLWGLLWWIHFVVVHWRETSTNLRHFHDWGIIIVFPFASQLNITFFNIICSNTRNILAFWPQNILIVESIIFTLHLGFVVVT
jgi:hypothetical protein